MNGGIIERAQKGTEAYTEEEIKEKIGTAYSEYRLAKYQTPITLQEALEHSGLVVSSSDITGSDDEGFEVTVNGKTYPLSPVGTVGNGIEKWIQNSDGSFSKGDTTGVQIGDIVKYEEVLPNVTLTSESQIIKDLAEYSGTTDNTYDKIVQDKNLKWKVLDIYKGKIRLISENSTSSSIKLQSYDGYNNGVYLIDEICNTLYSSSKGKSQNLKIEDIERHLNSKYTEDASSDSSVEYGNMQEYNNDISYPNIYPEEKGCKAINDSENTGSLDISEQTRKQLILGKISRTRRMIARQDYRDKLIDSDYFTNKQYYKLFIRLISDYPNYWLSSRCVHCMGSSFVYYKIRYVTYGHLFGVQLFDSRGLESSGTMALRPVVTLDSSAQLSGNSTDGWTIQ